MTARGIRNNNPLNLKITNNHWLGKDYPSKDEVFETFEKMVFGIRAGGKVLLRYHEIGATTIGKIVDKFAPSIENPTDAYKNTVSSKTGFDVDEEIDVTVAEILFSVLRAMASVECGPDAEMIADDEFTAGVNMALEKST